MENKQVLEESSRKNLRTFASSFTFRLAFLTIIISLLGLAVVFAVVNVIVRDVIYDGTSGKAKRDAIIYAEEVDKWFYNASGVVESLGVALSVIDRECTVNDCRIECFENVAISFRENFEFIENVFIGFSDGSIINSINWQPFPIEDGAEYGVGWGPWEVDGGGWTTLERPWYTIANEVGVGNVGRTEPYTSHSTGHITFAMTTYLPNLAGVGAAVGFSMSIEHVLNTLGAKEVILDGHIVLVTDNGDIVFHPDEHYITPICISCEHEDLHDCPGFFRLLDCIGLLDGECRCVTVECPVFVARNACPRNELRMWNINEIYSEISSEIISENNALEEFFYFYNNDGKGQYLISFEVDTVGWFVVTIVPIDEIDAIVSGNLLIIMIVLGMILIVLIGITIIFGAKISKSEKNEREKALIAKEKAKIKTRTQRSVYNSIPIPTSTWNAKHQMLDCNEKMLEFLQFANREMAKEHFVRRCCAVQPCETPTLQKIVELIDKALTKDEIIRSAWNYEIEGKIIPTELVITQTQWDNELVVTCYTIDLRATNELERKERESAFLIKTFYELSPFVMNTWDAGMNLISTSEQSAKIFGLESTEEYIRRFHELLPEFQPCGRKSSEMAYQIVAQAFEEGYAKIEWIHCNLEGEPIPMEVTLYRYVVDGVPFVATYAVDLREIKNAYRKRHEAEVRARVLLEASPISCFLIDGDFNIVECNFAAVDLHVIKKDENITVTYPDIPEFADVNCCRNCNICPVSRSGKVCFLRQFTINNFHNYLPESVHEKGGFLKFMETHASKAIEEQTHMFHLDVNTLYGETVSCEIVAVPVTYNEKPAFAAFTRSLEDEKRRLQAEEESRSKTKFLARMSHELRTPLNVILGMSEIQLANTSLHEEAHKAFLQIKNSSNSLVKIINDILDVSKVELGSVELNNSNYDVIETFVDIISSIVSQNQKNGNDFALSIDSNLPRNMTGDEMRVKQIIFNLILNAFKYTDNGKVELALSLEKNPEKSSNNNNEITLKIIVSDTGKGMTEEQIGKLFDKEFQRFDVEKGIEGTGLGMSIVNQFVKIMDGTIDVKSEVGEGTIITVRLPQQVEGSIVPIGEQVTKSLEKFDLGNEILMPEKHFKPLQPIPKPNGRVLIVDDLETNIYVASGLIKPYKLKEIDRAFSGAECLDKIKSGKVYDIIFMDHMMPEMDGIEALRAIRKTGYKHPVVVLTANATRNAKEMFLEAGFDAFVSKPIDPYLLDEVLNKYIKK
ncbi:MAG: ATP-binding protein [Oscillospiraceae bacterium]|nr:ATP-binding protein [Oscillospiraceae bacterium]